MPGAARRSKGRESRPRPLRAGPGWGNTTGRPGLGGPPAKQRPRCSTRRRRGDARATPAVGTPPRTPPPTGVPRAISGCNPTCQSSSIAIQCIRFYSYQHLAIVFIFFFKNTTAEKTGLIAVATTAWRHMHTAEKRKSICRCDEIRRTRCA